MIEKKDLYVGVEERLKLLRRIRDSSGFMERRMGERVKWAEEAEDERRLECVNSAFTLAGDMISQLQVMRCYDEEMGKTLHVNELVALEETARLLNDAARLDSEKERG